MEQEPNPWVQVVDALPAWMRASGRRGGVDGAGLHAQDIPSDIGAKVFAADLTVCDALDGGAVLGGNAGLYPRLHCLVAFDVELSGCSHRAAKQIDGSRCRLLGVEFLGHAYLCKKF